MAAFYLMRMPWRSRFISVVMLALAAVAPARAQWIEHPVSAERVERALADAGASVETAALLRAYAAYLEALPPVTREACAQFTAAGADTVHILGREQRGRLTAAEREWRRRSDELLVGLCAAVDPTSTLAARQLALSSWVERARNASGGSADSLMPRDDVAAVLACLPDAAHAEARRVIERTLDARIVALRKVVAECEDARLAMAREAERVGIVGQPSAELLGGEQPEAVRSAINLANFNVDGVRGAVAAYRALAVAMAQELRALIPPEQRAVRSGRLAMATMDMVSVRVQAPDANGNSSSECVDLAMNVLLTRGIPDAARAKVVDALAELMRFEGELAWRMAAASGSLEGADYAASRDSVRQSDAILARVREAIGIADFDGWLLDNGLVDSIPREAELEKLGISKAHAEAALRYVRSRAEAEHSPVAGAGAAAATDAGAERLAALLLGHEANEGERELVRDLLERLNARIAAEVRPLERAVTKFVGGLRTPEAKDARLEEARAFGVQLRSAVPKRMEVERAFIDEVRAALGADAAAVAEAMLASSAARDLRSSARVSTYGRVFSENLGGTPLDLDALALSLDAAAARAWLRGRLVAHGPRLRACADAARRDALRLFAADAAVDAALAALRFDGNDPDPGSAALFEAFPEARDYVRVVIGPGGTEIGPAQLDPIIIAAVSSLDAWRAAEREAFAADGTSEGGGGGPASAVARAILRQRITEPSDVVDEIAQRHALVEGHGGSALLAELLAGSAARAVRARDEALAVYQAPVDARAIASESGLDAEYGRRMISALAASGALSAERRFARFAFERLATEPIRAEFARRRN